MPAILALLLFISQAVLSCPTTELQVHSSRQDTKSSFQSRSIAHWDAPLQTFSILITILLILVILGWIIRDRCCIHHAGLNQDDAAPESESSSLLGTRVSSSTTLHDNYQSYRGAKLILQNVHATYSESILGGHGDYVTSPMESIPCLFEPPKIVVQAPDSVTRGRTSAVTQKAKSISSNHFDPAMDESQVHESEDCQSSKASKKRAQSQHGPPSITTPIPANETRAQTAPCIKIRSASLAKSLTGLVSLQQAIVHVLAVGMSWEGIAGGSRVLPGPHHDIEWLRNLFSFQKNFRFSSLLDHAATLTAIRQSLENMLSVASEDDPLVLYFSGHGGQGDSFELYGSILLTEVMLNEWIVQFRSTALRNSPVYIIFDFCRPDRVKPNTELASGVNVIWACSPTESALDLRLKDPKNHLPRSCFLLSLILAIDDVSEDPKPRLFNALLPG
ncbi:hypothetical protein RSOLAG22IIIB_03523 [Rhizoctonia solani]|uniref:Peptidase C14 caspase domain-containing protein n=1 Tax=Rhizoctonia solani TaxID=456999 RepID=A0A0K6FQH4_9AGAM|nr:hypothetical protein RSOLAG22IIIB_03523 [Rhizoctonia solani]